MGAGRRGVVGFFARHQCVQVDPIDVAGRNADLTLQSRVVGYRREHLTDLLYKERRLFEYYCKMLCILPIELYPLFKRQMASYSSEERTRAFFRKYKAETRQILKALEKGPVSSRDVDSMGRVKSGWGHNMSVSNMILTRLWISGRVGICGRDGPAKTYCLPEDILPEHLLAAEPPKNGEDINGIARIIVNAARLVTPTGSADQWHEVGNAKEVREILQHLERERNVFEVEVEGSKEKFYAPVEDMEHWETGGRVVEDYVRFLAPLDPLIWNRRVFSTVYGMEYSWEIYKKPENRKYGYYCLPIMFNGEYVGLIEPYLRKKERVLEIRSFHFLAGDVKRSSFLSALSEELERFCAYLNAEGTEVRQSPAWVRGALTIAA